MGNLYIRTEITAFSNAPRGHPDCYSRPSVLFDNQIFRMLLPLWGVAFVAGLVLTACHR